MLRRTLLAATLAAGFVGTASAATVHYVAHLDGKSEVPPTESKASGLFEATYNTKTKELTYTLTFSGLSGPATAAHIHGPATRGHNAGVVVPLGSKSPTSPVSGSATLTVDQAKMLRTHHMYVNVHTAASPAGEIRGQLMRATAARHAKKRYKAPAAETPAAAAAPMAPAAGSAATAPDTTAPAAPAK